MRRCRARSLKYDDYPNEIYDKQEQSMFVAHASAVIITYRLASSYYLPIFVGKLKCIQLFIGQTTF